MKIEFKGMNALLTGASRGIGVPIAEELARRGVNLAITARQSSEGELNRTAELCARYGVSVVPILADLKVSEDRKRLVQQATEQLGPIDILINNAGIEWYETFVSVSDERIRSIMETNLLAPMDLTRMILPSMLERKQGHIINISSMAGKSYAPYNSIYAATKAGMIGWTWSIRTEVASSGVNVSAIIPGFISSTGMHARTGLKAPWSAREVTPEKVARSVIHAIETGQVEVFVMRLPVQFLLAIKELSPRFALWFYKVTGVNRNLEENARRSREVPQRE